MFRCSLPGSRSRLRTQVLLTVELSYSAFGLCVSAPKRRPCHMLEQLWVVGCLLTPLLAPLHQTVTSFI